MVLRNWSRTSACLREYVRRDIGLIVQLGRRISAVGESVASPPAHHLSALAWFSDVAGRSCLGSIHTVPQGNTGVLSNSRSALQCVGRMEPTLVLLQLKWENRTARINYNLKRYDLNQDISILSAEQRQDRTLVQDSERRMHPRHDAFEPAGRATDDRATRGSDPSADPGAKTGAGGTMPPLGLTGLAQKR
jgi:hypothetical protein